MTIAFKTLMPSWGAEVDLDLAQPLSESVAAELIELYDTHHLLLFRNQTLSAERQVAFARLFGAMFPLHGAIRLASGMFVLAGPGAKDLAGGHGRT